MKNFEIKKSLEALSLKIERIGGELVFTHDKKHSSILLPRDEWKDDLLPVNLEPLASFYSEYFGASIGNGQLVIATNIEGGIQVSHGFKIPDFNQMAAQAIDLGLKFKESEFVFLSEAAWMFVYTLSDEHGQTVLRKYDRDFGGCQIIQTLDEVLENWWKIATEK